MPTNISAATALEIATLPYTVTITPDSATQVLWWTYTPVDCETVIGIRPWTDDDATYRPEVAFWEGMTAANLSALVGGVVYFGPEPTYIPVTPGLPVFFQIGDFSTGTPAGTLQLTVASAPRRQVTPGDLIISDDGRYLPATVRSRADGSVVRYVPVVPAEEAASAKGSMLVSDSWSSENLVLYNQTGTEKKTYFPIGPVNTITQNRRDTYYVVWGTDFHKITSDVLETMPYALPHSDIQGVAVDENLDRLYYTRPPANNQIKYLTLSDGTGATDWVDVAGYRTCGDMLIMPDGSLVTGHIFGSTNLLKRHNPDGTEAWSIDMGTDEIYHLAHDVNPLQFWVWFYPLLTGENGRFRLFNVNTGDVLIEWDRPTFRFGQMNGDGTATSEIFGHSQSCTFWVAPENCDECGCESVIPPRPIPGTVPPRGLSGESEGDDPTREWQQWTTICAFGGTVPTGTNGSDTESWA